ncbi:transcription activator MSS11-like isoform X2 [Leptopilina heterotoma]|uniref:transcription activator MSS11-like isoform X2 n=1 Tax=Leptopilina heterotoma TaxID=63436 RepID=UPI001CAA24BF|nr:transcription activator MSS11-like isoform X2 [Leptopilina heterotoma]
MLLRLAVIFFVVIVSVVLATEDSMTETSISQGTTPPVKLDKTLRRALLRALTDLETESAEQHASNNSEENQTDDENFKKNERKEEENFGKSTFSFNHFSGDDETSDEEKLQNSTFIEIEKFVSSDSPVTLRTIIDKPRHFIKVTNAISPANLSSKQKQDKTTELRNLKSSSPSSANEIETVTLKSTTQFTETLIRSESSGIVAANALVAPRPTVPSPTVQPATNTSSRNAATTTKPNKEDDVEDVKIFQAPLVAAFTVQQDERGIPKSVVPIYRPSGDGQALTLQEQLDFKQKLLEKQLADLQQQQIQQTQFLLRQQQAYEERVRQKQQQEIYSQEQARLKRLQEQTRLKQIDEQRQKQFEEQRQKQFEDQRQKQFEEQRQKQFEEQRQKQFEEQRQKQFEEHVRLKQLEEQRIYQQRLQLQQQQHNFHQLQQQQLPIEQNNILPFKQQLKNNNVRLQPSIALELPQNIPAIPFQFQDQLRVQQHRQQLQFHQQQNFLQPFQQQQLPPKQQPPQKLQQQAFAPYSSDFQPPIVPPTRFNRQEGFGSVGNFGFNVDNGSSNRNTFNYNLNQQRSPTSSNFDQFGQFRQARQPTPAKQIQNLLYQSGIANELQNGIQGFPGSQEDLNIVSKVLALNVGAVPLNTNNVQFDVSQQRAIAYNRAPSVA